MKRMLTAIAAAAIAQGLGGTAMPGNAARPVPARREVAGSAVRAEARPEGANPRTAVAQAAEMVPALHAEAVKAYRAKDYGGFLADEKRDLVLAPSNARVLYNVACGESLAPVPPTFPASTH